MPQFLLDVAHSGQGCARRQACFDQRQMRMHGLQRACCIAFGERHQDFFMFLAGAFGCRSGFEKRHQHRGAAQQFLQFAHHQRAAGAFGQQYVKFAR